MRLTLSRENMAIRIILIPLLILCIMLTGCGVDSEENKETLEVGFAVPYGDPSPPPRFCAYRSERTEFPIDDVTLEFYYGGRYIHGVEWQRENAYSYPSFELYFSDDTGKRIFVKRVDENFVSEKYRCYTESDDEACMTYVKFNYSETLTIPAELFCEKIGGVYLTIYGTNERDKDPHIECITSVGISYKLVGDKVILSKTLFSE